MKILGLVAAFGLSLFGMTAIGQSRDAEVPGDNFSLEGALELFKKSKSPEEFERLLNSPDSRVNNLDLNRDNYIDYIRVIDRTRGNVHTFTMQAVLSENESQDVAVIELEKRSNGDATLQITGDADVYGMETIIEPTEEVRVNAGTTTVRNVVNVWTWPSVQYVYQPYYEVWVSPWYWSYRPVWWRPWRPVAYYVYDPWWRPYRPYYSVCHVRRSYYAYDLYRPYRTTSVIVHHHYGPQIDRYRSRYDSRHDSYGRDNRGGRDRFEGRGYAESRDRQSNNAYGSTRERTRNDYRSETPQRYQRNESTNESLRQYRDRSNSGDRKTFDADRKPEGNSKSYMEKTRMNSQTTESKDDSNKDAIRQLRERKSYEEKTFKPQPQRESSSESRSSYMERSKPAQRNAQERSQSGYESLRRSSNEGKSYQQSRSDFGRTRSESSGRQYQPQRQSSSPAAPQRQSWNNAPSPQRSAPQRSSGSERSSQGNGRQSGNGRGVR